jgi:hypothetical protein
MITPQHRQNIKPEQITFLQAKLSLSESAVRAWLLHLPITFQVPSQARSLVPRASDINQVCWYP